ncbi:hypothetical protein [Pseudomonas haemolytica]|jgi:hypothetical protein|uniref:TIGR04086 family membrane protein n=1 Tax=Pseudomonas haemolytica TaxID=2600065 RepID=A0ABS1H0N5_9PSED|nr:hypothetical protein [Pseudomonas haemolytica]MBK3462667.1 hypothetical protein [Pseudomonas haemolytica]
MNSIKEYLGTGFVLLLVATALFATSFIVFRFGFLDTKHVGLFIAAEIATVIALYFAVKFISSAEQFSFTMMIASILVGGYLLPSGMSSFGYFILFAVFCYTLEHFGFYKAIYRGLGGVLGSVVSAVHKPKVNKYSKYL